MSERLEWQFDVLDGISEPTESASASLAALVKMMSATTGGLDRLNAKIDGLAPKSQAAGGQMGILKQGIGDVAIAGARVDLDKLFGANKTGAITVGWMAVFDAIKGAITGLISLVGSFVNTLTDGISRAIGVAARTERLGLSLDLQLGRGQASDLRRYFDAITGGRGRIAFGNEALIQAALPLLQVGARGQDLRRAVSFAGDVEAMVGGGLQRVQNVFNAMAKIRVTGKVESEALGVFGLTLTEIGKTLGTTAAGAQKILSSGALKPGQLIDTLYATLANKTGLGLGGAAVAAAGTVEAKLQRLRELPERYLQVIAQSPGFSAMGGFLDRLLAMLDPNGPTGARIIAGVETLANKILALFAGISPDSIDRAVDGLVRLGSMAINAAPSLETLGRALSAVVGILEDYVDLVGRAGQIFNVADADVRVRQRAQAEAGSLAGDILGFNIPRAPALPARGASVTSAQHNTINVHLPEGTPREQAEAVARELPPAFRGATSAAVVAASVGGG